MTTLFVDFETRSRCDLKAHGTYLYAADPSTEVLCLSYAFGNEDVRTWVPGDTVLPATIAEHTGRIVAHNAAFERLIFKHVLRLPFKLEQFYCTAAQARANCMPGGLGDIGRFAGLGMRKDYRGAQLIRALSLPRPDGSFREDEDLLQEMIEYCEQDVRVMREFYKAARHLTDEELHDYHVNERVNDLGVRIDVPLCKSAMDFAEEERHEIEALVRDITEGDVPNVRSRNMCQWVYDRVGPEAKKLMESTDETGAKKISVDKAVRANLLELAEERGDEVPPAVADVVQCADDLWSSSVAKFKRMVELADPDDDRARGAFVFAGGAATGRAACVSYDTLITTECGAYPITHVLGRKVLTHTGRFCKATHLYYKGQAEMYRVVCASGATVTCTGDHRLLTSQGWKHVKELISNKRPGDPEKSNASILLASVPYDGGDRENMRTNARDSECDCTRDHTCRSASHTEGGELLPIKEGREEPCVWVSQAGGGDTSRGLQVSLERGERGLRSRTPCSINGCPGVERMANRVGGPSHRQQQNEQFIRQLGDCDQSWASTVTFSEVREIVYVGKKGVWDITVERDASYCAQGLIHHNSYGLQVHNIPRQCAKNPEQVRADMVEGYEIVPEHGPTVAAVLKSMLRPSIIPADGHVFVVADWSAIEGRVNPWLAKSAAGEQKLDQYRDKLDPYIVNAASTYGVPYEEILAGKKAEVGKYVDMRQCGKVQELALSYGGKAGSFSKFASVYKIRMTEAEVERAIRVWVKNNPWMSEQGDSLDTAMWSAMRHPGREFHGPRVTYMFDGTHLWYALPSGRILCYPFAKIEKDSVTYRKAAWKPAASAKEWPRGRLWYGELLNNCTQATAHDLLRHAMRELDDLYYRIVLHVHDEIVVEVPEEEADQCIKDMTEIMTAPPAWAAGLPLEIDIKTHRRYGK